MRVNIAGLLKNAAENTDRKAVAYYVGCIEEVVEHLRDVADGKRTFEEFAEHYCIKPRSEKSAAEYPPRSH